MSIFQLIVALFIVFGVTNGAKILAVAPSFSRSHFILQQPLFKELAASGHEITVVSAFPNKTPIPNYKDVHLSKVLDFFDEMSKDFDGAEMNVLQALGAFFGMGIDVCRLIAMGPELQAILKSNATFDVILLEVFMDECLIGLGHYYNAPIIGIATSGATKWINDFLGNSNPPSHIPHIMLPVTSNMNFLQRLGNVFMTYFEEFYLELFVHPQYEKIYDVAFPNPKPTYSEARNTAIHLGLLNTHFSLAYGRPYVSNMIEVAGMHVSRKGQPLPEPIEKFLQKANNDVIYFSLGSNVRPSDVQPEKFAAIVQTLIKRKEHIIWKWDGEVPEIEGKNNILLSKWLPQEDILRHPKIGLFITHGGLLSTTETIYHGVPVVGIPFFGDQDLNMAKAEQAGYGKTCPYDTLTEELLTNAIDEVINNKSYKETVLEVSKRFRDRPMHPLDLAKYWVEYVIRHKGARHMRSASMDLNWIQLNSLDTVGTIVGVLIIVVLLIVFSLKKLCFLICGSKCSNNKKIKKN